MDSGFQRIKEDDSCQREALIGSYLIQHPRPISRPPTATGSPPNIWKPPVKPRRSIKCRPITGSETEQLHSRANQKENEEANHIGLSQVLNPAWLLETQSPCLQTHNKLWFQITQLPRLPKPVPCWFHGFVTRREAEQLLQDKQQGCFLLRLSESKVGFVLSYRGADKCRHFIIEQESEMPGSEGQYVIVGENSRHCSLEDLLNYYTINPVGPFNETLTVPCVQTNRNCEDKAKLAVRNEIAEKCGEMEEKRATIPASIFDNPAVESTEHVPHVGSELPQYAVVKKTLKKAHSLTECMTEPNFILLEGNTNCVTKVEITTQEPVLSNAGRDGDVASPVDAPYARVNKLPRAMSPSAINNTNAAVQGASTATDSQFFASAASISEQKYWKLEPMHTYEEALHTRAPDEQIGFFAVGTCKEKAGVAGACSAQHVYSEVNVKGTREITIPMSVSPPSRPGTFDSTPSSSRPTPRLPLRPPPRLIQEPVHLDRTQGLITSPQHHSEQLQPGNSAFPIYEQIPERPGKPRPPLPPPNTKR